MSKLPMIQTKRKIQVLQEEDYNFTNKEKKRKDSAKQLGSPLQMIQQLKHKIQQQKAQIDNRNTTIKGLQRNFQSLSTIVKNQKAVSAALRAQLQSLKQNQGNGQTRATQYHQKCIKLQNQIKALKQQIAIFKKAHSNCDEQVIINENLKKVIKQMETKHEKLTIRMNTIESQKQRLQEQLFKYRSTQREKRNLNERIVDLQEQLKKISDLNNTANLKKQLLDEELSKYKLQKDKLQKAIQEQVKKNKEIMKNLKGLQEQNAQLRRLNENSKKQMDKVYKNLQNKDMFTKMKLQEQEQHKNDIKDLHRQIAQLKKTISELEEDNQKKVQFIKVGHQQIQNLRKENIALTDKYTVREKQYLKQIEKLTISIQQVNSRLDLTVGHNSTLSKKLLKESEKQKHYTDQIGNMQDSLDSMNNKLKDYDQRYSKYLKKIDQYMPDVIIMGEDEWNKIQSNSGSSIKVLTDKVRNLEIELDSKDSKLSKIKQQMQIMKNYIQSLQQQINEKCETIKQLTNEVQKYKQQEQKLSEMIQNQKLQSQKLKKQTEEQKQLSRKLIQEEKQRNRKRIQQQQAKAAQILQKYRRQQQKLKDLISKEQQQTNRLTQQKQKEIQRLIKEKQQQLERERHNNKLLWSDNKKLKEMERSLRDQASREIQEREKNKQQEISKLKQQLQSKYKRQISELKTVDQSNSHQLKKLMIEKANQMKTLSENYRTLNETNHKLKSQLQFYKNRNKELEGVVARTQKKHKQMIIDIERQNKSNKEVINVLDSKLKASEQEKQRIFKRSEEEIAKISEELKNVRIKFLSMKLEQKTLIIQRSLDDMATSLKTLFNTLTCNYCIEVVKDCIRISECGHIYCRKCKAGYEPNCGQCKKKGNILNDRMIDEVVTKGEYMKLILTAVMEDIKLIAMKQ